MAFPQGFHFGRAAARAPWPLRQLMPVTELPHTRLENGGAATALHLHERYCHGPNQAVQPQRPAAPSELASQLPPPSYLPPGVPSARAPHLDQDQQQPWRHHLFIDRQLQHDLRSKLLAAREPRSVSLAADPTTAAALGKDLELARLLNGTARGHGRNGTMVDYCIPRPAQRGMR